MPKVVLENRTNDPAVVACGDRDVLVEVNQKLEVDVDERYVEELKSSCPQGVLCNVLKQAKTKLAMPEKTKDETNMEAHNE
jgi:hypothetical protein